MVHLRTLGGVAISNTDGNPVTLRSKKHLGLLILLVCNERRVYSRSRLCEFFWKSHEEKARHSLSQAIYDITQRVGPIIRRGPAEDISVNPGRISCDVSSFEAAVQDGRLGEAVRVYQGPFADNLIGVGTEEFEIWLDAERTRLDRLGEITLRRYVDQCETHGQWGEMCLAALKLAAMAPFDEEVHRSFMRALWLHGQGASALRHYESVMAMLESELPEGISAQTKELVERIRERPNREIEGSLSIDRDPPFVGREKEFRVLRAIAADIGVTETTAVVLSGEGGIGKSRLMREFTRSLELESLRVLTSRCYQAEEDLPYSPIVDAITPLAKDMMASDPSVGESFQRLAFLLPDFGSRAGQERDRGSVDPPAWRRQLFEEVASFLATAAKREPIIWIIDDAQWIDRASRGLIHYVSRRLGKLPFLLVLTIRNPREADELPALPVAVPEPGRLSTISLPLRPLSEEHIREIICNAGQGAKDDPAADLAVRLSAGNPFYALEVLEAAMESREWAKSATDWDPLNHDRLRKVLDIRISGLGREAARLLTAIAVLERHARPRLVAEVAGMSLTDAANFGNVLYERSLVVDDAERIAFTNDAMREFVYSRMSSLQRASLHLGAGRVLEREVDATPGVLATHFFLGDDWPRSFGYAMEAARSAQSSAGHDEAAHFAGIAVKVAPGSQERRVALETRADSLFAAGGLSAAASCYQEVLRSGPLEASDVSGILLRLAATEMERCNWKGAEDALDDCEDAIGRVQPVDQRLFLLAEHSTLRLKHATRTDDTESARTAAGAVDNALVEVRQLDASNQTRLAILTAKAVSVGLNGPITEALKYLEEAEAYINGVEVRQLVRYFTYRGIVKAWSANWDGAEADFEHSRTLAARSADRVGMMTQWNNLACIALERGDWPTAEERLSQATNLQSGLDLSNDTSLPITLNEANLQFYQGYLPKAAVAYSSAARMCDEQESSDRAAEIIACQGLVALQRGEKESATRYWKALQESRQPGLGTRERFKVAWFRSAMVPEITRSGYLLEVADDEKQKDVPSGLKLLWLDVLLSNRDQASRSRARQLLKDHGLGWFCYFATRWARSAGYIVSA